MSNFCFKQTANDESFWLIYDFCLIEPISEPDDWTKFSFSLGYENCATFSKLIYFRLKNENLCAIRFVENYALYLNVKQFTYSEETGKT